MTTKRSRPILPHLEGTLEYLEATSTFFGGRNWEPKFVTVARSALVVSKSKPAYEKSHHLEQVDLLQVDICEASIEGSSKQYIFKVLGPGVDRSFACRSTEELHNWINKLKHIKEYWTKSYQSLSRTTENSSELIENGTEHGNTANGSTNTFQLNLHMNNNVQKTIELPKQHSSFHDLFHELSMQTNCPDCSTCSVRKRNSRLYCVNKHGDIVHVEKEIPLYPFFKAGSSFFMCEQQTEQLQQQQLLLVVHINDTHIACLVDMDITCEELQSHPVVTAKMQESITKQVCVVLLYEAKSSGEKSMQLLAHDDKPLTLLYDDDWEPTNHGRLVIRPVTEYLSLVKGTDGASTADAVADMSAKDAVLLERGEIGLQAVRLSSGQIVLEKCEIKRSRDMTGNHEDYNNNEDMVNSNQKDDENIKESVLNGHHDENGHDPTAATRSRYPALSEDSDLSNTGQESDSSEYIDAVGEEDEAADMESYTATAVVRKTLTTATATNIMNSDEMNSNSDTDKNTSDNASNGSASTEDAIDEVSKRTSPTQEQTGPKEGSDTDTENVVTSSCPDVSNKEVDDDVGTTNDKPEENGGTDIQRIDSYRTVIRKHMQDNGSDVNGSPEKGSTCIDEKVDVERYLDGTFSVDQCGVSNGGEGGDGGCGGAGGAGGAATGETGTSDNEAGVNTTTGSVVDVGAAGGNGGASTVDCVQVCSEVETSEKVVETFCPVDAFDTVGTMDSYASIRSISLSSQDGLDVSINASKLVAHSPDDNDTTINTSNGDENQPVIDRGNESSNEKITEPKACQIVEQETKSSTNLEQNNSAENDDDSLVKSSDSRSSSPSKSSTLCHLCSSTAANKRPQQIRSKESMKRLLDTPPAQGCYVCLLGTHLLYQTNGWELTDGCQLCKDSLDIEKTKDKRSRFNIGNGFICVWVPRSNNNAATWLVKRIGESNGKKLDVREIDDSDDDYGETSSIERSFELPTRQPEAPQKQSTSPIHSIINTIRERKSSVREKYNVVMESIDTDEIRDTINNAKQHLVESAKLAKNTFDTISESGLGQVDGGRLLPVDHGILPPLLVDFQKLYIKPLQVVICEISSQFETLTLLEQRNHGDDIKTPPLGWLVRNDLCTALAKLLHVGLQTGRSILKSLFGRVEETTLWRVVRDFSLAYNSNCFTTVVGYVERSRWLVNDDMKFRYFVCELLNRSTTDGSEKLIVTWLRNFPHQTNMVNKYYVPNSFWRMYYDEHCVLLVEEIVKSLELFNGIPFHLHDFFEMQLLKLRSDSVRSVRANSQNGPQCPDEDDIVCVFE